MKLKQHLFLTRPATVLSMTRCFAEIKLMNVLVRGAALDLGSSSWLSLNLSSDSSVCRKANWLNSALGYFGVVILTLFYLSPNKTDLKFISTFRDLKLDLIKEK